MSKKDKLSERLLSRPADFTFEELVTLLNRFGYSARRAGKTGGSRVTFSNGEGDYLRFHKPHPKNVMKKYQIDEFIAFLTERGFL